MCDDLAKANHLLNVKEGCLVPQAVPLLIKELPFFELGIQGDAQEFLYFLLENLISASFNYRNDVSFKSHWESFIPRVFQGLVQKSYGCKSCGDVRTLNEPFLDLSLVSNYFLTLQDIKTSESSTLGHSERSIRVKPVKM